VYFKHNGNLYWDKDINIVEQKCLKFKNFVKI